jgi:hypothetical protein
MKANSAVLWVLTIVITLASSVYQRRTGPTKPVRGNVEISNENVKFRLIRTHETGQNAAVRIKVDNSQVSGIYQYKRFKSFDEWTETKMVREGEHLVAYIPEQPPAGKVMYDIWLTDGAEKVKLNKDHVIMRFKGHVPAAYLIPHIVFMLLAMVFSMRAGFEALFRRRNIYLFTLLTLIFLVLGGAIFGPIVQKFAFGDYWTGWPFGTDLTDNKTAVALIFWIVAFIRVYRNRQERGWVIAAAIVLFAIYMIPHSMMGSELDHTVEAIGN